MVKGSIYAFVSPFTTVDSNWCDIEQIVLTCFSNCIKQHLLPGQLFQLHQEELKQLYALNWSPDMTSQEQGLFLTSRENLGLSRYSPSTKRSSVLINTVSDMQSYCNTRSVLVFIKSIKYDPPFWSKNMPFISPSILYQSESTAESTGVNWEV